MTTRTSQLDRSLEAVRSLLKNPALTEDPQGSGTSQPDSAEAIRLVAEAGIMGPLRSAPFLGSSPTEEPDAGRFLDAAGVSDHAPGGGPASFLGQLGPATPRLGTRITVIADETLHRHLEGLADLSLVTRDSAAEGGLDTDLLILSPRSAQTAEDFSALAEDVLPTLRRRAAPAVFWDYGLHEPSESALSLAQNCSVVFAASEEQVQRYREKLAAEPAGPAVELLPSGVNPLHHSPIGSRGRLAPSSPEAAASRTVVFSEAWTPPRPDQAGELLAWILDGVIAAELPLVLPLHEDGLEAVADLSARHRPYLTSSQSPREIAETDRRTDLGITLNPVAHSQSAVSPRVLELLASGTMVLASYNQGVNSYLPEVHLANSERDVADALSSLTPGELRRIQADGIRQVFLERHAGDQLRRLCRAAGLDVPQQASPRLLAVAEEVPQHLRENLLSEQTHPVQDVVTWEELGTWESDYEVLLPVSGQRHYSPDYVADHLAAFTYQSAKITAKLDGDALDTDSLAHRHHQGFDALDVPLELTAWWRPSAAELTGEALRSSARHTRLYAIDHQGHSLLRERRPIAVEDATAASGPAAEGLELTVILPVYNNGGHLRHKAFASLRRSSVFERMHVLLVDDGSTDPMTVGVVEELAAEWPNVTAYRHAPGGSGSASRPRNTGLDLTTTPYVTYLDPDNEMVEDGFAKLLAELEEHPEVNFAVGGMTIWSTGLRMQDYHQVLMTALSDCVDAEGTIHVPEDVLARLKFRPFGIQTLVARTEWLQSLGLEQPVGAVGQDTYFFQQMLHYAERIRTVRTPIHTYYSAVSNSTVNTINARYFDKYRALDEARSQWLREVGLLEAYNQTRLERFTEQWHLPKLRRVPEDQWLEAAENLAGLLACYGRREWESLRIQEFFAQLDQARKTSRRD